MVGSDPETDLAIQKMPEIKRFLQQGLNESYDVTNSVQQLMSVISKQADAPKANEG